MLNKEFYSEEILKKALPLLGFVNGEWTSCHSMSCKNCKFNRLIQSCVSLKEEFLKQKTQVSQLGFTLQDENGNFISEDDNIFKILNTKRILIVSLKGYKSYLSYLHKILINDSVLSPFDKINEKGIFYYNEKENKFEKAYTYNECLETIAKAAIDTKFKIIRTEAGYFLHKE